MVSPGGGQVGVRGRVCGGFSEMWCWGWVSTRGTYVGRGGVVAGGVVGYLWGRNVVVGCVGWRKAGWVRLAGGRLRWVWGMDEDSYLLLAEVGLIIS
jgi:hypothetical protein